MSPNNRVFLLKSQNPWGQGVYFPCPPSLSTNTWNFLYHQKTCGQPLQISDLDSVVNFHRPFKFEKLIHKKPKETAVITGIFYDSDDEDELYQ
jgi:hypothetical protein